MPVSLLKEEEKHIISILPFLLRKDKQFRYEVEGVLSDTFVKRNEITKILEEMRQSREESSRRFDEMSRQTNQRFEEMNQRFDEMSQQTNQRFEEINQRFDEMNRQTNQRFDEMNRQTNQRFEEMNRQTNQRFEEINQRFDEMNRQTNQRFDEMSHQTNQRFDEQGKAIASLAKSVEKMGMSIRTIGSRWGKDAEETIRNTLRELLLRNLKVTDVSEWRSKDKKGMVGQPGAGVQVDLLIRNGEHLLAEIKSSADEAHVDRLYKIGELYAKEVGVQPKLLFVAVSMREEGQTRCQELGIQLISYDELES